MVGGALHLTSSRGCWIQIHGCPARSLLPSLILAQFFPQEKGDDIKSLAVHKA